MKATLAVLVNGAILCSMAFAQEASSPVTGWVKQNAIRLTTPESGHGFEDMQPLKKAIGNARIVALGEATHGTREFFQMKHRMMEFLATEMGFTIFSIEANMPEAYRLNEYVLTGKGDPAQLLKGMYFWTWNTEEVLAMIRWMREFNQSGKGRVEFTGFDMQTPNVAAEIVKDFVEKNDTGYAAGFGKAFEMAVAPSRKDLVLSDFGGITGSFPVADAAGKTVRFSGYIKTQIVDGYAGLWWQVDGAPGGPHLVNLGGNAPKGTTDWRRYELEIKVAREAKNINFGALLAGGGTAWFDGLWVQLDGKAYEGAAFDFDFEGTSPKGFTTYGNGYQVRPDFAEFHSGKQSLLVRRVGLARVDPRSVAKVAAGAWKDVMAHLEKSRAAYTGKKVATGDIDWTIQNARVVLQCMEMRTNEVSRDQSMADNIQWILDHSSKAKIVLWAHNGHVATGGYRGYQPMGAALRKIYGDRMVVFGFGFNQGSFQAVDMYKALRNFTVAPGPAGGLDAKLAATGIPLFALDLRQIPGSGPVAEWWRQPHKAHTIGAVYSEARVENYLADLDAPRSFDVLLFVEKTTAARKNP